MRILVVQKSLSPPGGGNAVAAWMVHALAGDHEVATLTARPWDEAETNAFYGTSIPERTITKYVTPLPWQWLGLLPEGRANRLRMCAVLRFARPITPQYDIVVTADDFAPFAKPGFQYVHFPARLQPPPARWTALVNIYFAWCDRLVGAPWSDAVRNTTFVNSLWTAEHLQRLGEIPTPVVLYPPVVDPGAGLPWEQRDDVFLCIGRYDATKRIERTIAIVKKIRERYLPHARLKLVGSAVDRKYANAIRALARSANWIEFHEDLSRVALNELMRRSRYGMQSMEGEHFGMATAEMTRAGCLVFAHRSGGTPEVLNHEESLLWTTEDEAVEQFGVLEVDAVRARLRDHVHAFSVERFIEQFRTLLLTSVGGTRDR